MAATSLLIPKYAIGNPRFMAHVSSLKMCSNKSLVAWEAIIEEWNGNITKEAIAEAVQLATQALLKHAAKFVVETMSDGTPSHGGKEVQYIC